MKDIFDKPLKMIWGNDFNTHFRINKSDKITVKAYGWDKKAFFKVELNGIHTVKQAIDYVRAHISKELVWVSLTNETTSYKAVYAIYKNTFKRTIITDLEQ